MQDIATPASSAAPNGDNNGAVGSVSPPGGSIANEVPPAVDETFKQYVKEVFKLKNDEAKLRAQLTKIQRRRQDMEREIKRKMPPGRRHVRFEENVWWYITRLEARQLETPDRAEKLAKLQAFNQEVIIARRGPGGALTQAEMSDIVTELGRKSDRTVDDVKVDKI